jgi:tetratricopeptide (TPR) repeat protein
MVQIRSSCIRNTLPSSKWPKHQSSNNKECKGIEKFALTLQPQFVQPREPPKRSQTKKPDPAQSKNVQPQQDTPKRSQTKKADPESKNENTALSLIKRGVEHHQNGEYEDALRTFQVALKTQRNVLGEEHLAVAHTLANIGAVFLRQGQLYLAGEALEKALQMKKSFSNNCKDEGTKSKIVYADVLNNLGNVAYLRGHYPLSMYFYRTALKELRKRKEVDRELANALHNIGRLYVIKEEWDVALSVLTQCLRIEEDLYGKNEIALAGTIELIGFVHLSSGAFDNAMVSFSEALYIYQDKVGVVNEKVASSLVNVAMVMKGRGQLRGARQAYITARDVFGRVGVGSEHRGLKAVIRSIENIEQLIMAEKRSGENSNQAAFVPIDASAEGEESISEHDNSEDEYSYEEAREDDDATYEM